MRHFFLLQGVSVWTEFCLSVTVFFLKNGYNFRERIIFAENKRTGYFVTQTDEKD